MDGNKGNQQCLFIKLFMNPIMLYSTALLLTDILFVLTCMKPFFMPVVLPEGLIHAKFISAQNSCL